MRQTTQDKIRAVYKKGGVAKDCMNEVLGLLNCEDRAEEMSKDVQELLFLANVTASYMDMTPTHPLYCSVGRDVKASLLRLFSKKEGTEK